MSAERITIGLTCHCEERSNEAIQSDANAMHPAPGSLPGACHRTARIRAGLLARNDGARSVRPEHASRRLLTPADWDKIRLVVFDVDGTLYSQQRLRLRLLRDMMVHAAKTRSLDVPLVIRAYRRIRERIAERDVVDFETALVAETAAATRLSATEIRAVVDEWIERGPLPYLARAFTRASPRCSQACGVRERSSVFSRTIPQQQNSMC